MLQQSTLTLALVYDTPLENSPYYQSERLREWALAGVRFWAQIQHADGAFDEYYPWEHGYIPTSFSLFAAAETCRILAIEDEAIHGACLRAARYLAANEEREALNQEAASIPGLYAAYLLTGKEWIAEAAEAKVARFLQKQSPDGFFAEYGGADLGYLSTTLDFLLEYQRMSGDERIWPAAERVLDLSRYFVHQDGSVGGQYGSRNTEYFLLSPLCLMAARSPTARAMLERLRHGKEGAMAVYGSFDDRYLCHNMLHSLLRAVRYGSEVEDGAESLPCDVEHERYFEDAGLLSINRSGAHLVCALSKGGVLRLFANGREIFSDYGYRVETKVGNPAATSWLRADFLRGGSEGTYRVEGDFSEVPRQRVTPLKHMALRLLAKMWGKRLIPMLKKRLIFVDHKGPARFARQLSFVGDELLIDDEIEVESSARRLYTADKFSLRHVASAKYYQVGELRALAVATWQRVRRVVVKRRIDLHSGQVVTSQESS